MQGIFQKENTDKALKYGIYRHLPTYEKIIRNLVSFSINKNQFINFVWCITMNNVNSNSIVWHLNKKQYGFENKICSNKE